MAQLFQSMVLLLLAKNLCLAAQGISQKNEAQVPTIILCRSYIIPLSTTMVAAHQRLPWAIAWEARAITALWENQGHLLAEEVCNKLCLEGTVL